MDVAYKQETPQSGVPVFHRSARQGFPGGNKKLSFAAVVMYVTRGES
jgi:hypothetical protein